MPFGALLAYSPRGQSETSKKSRNICYAIKNDQSGIIGKAAEVLKSCLHSGMEEFFGPDRILVPVPRSSPIKEGALWPPLRICEEIVAAGLAREVRPWLQRVKPVTKSASAGIGQRPDPAAHFETIESREGGLLPLKITLIDDVVTRGSTLCASVALLRHHFPAADVKAFALVRTCGLVPDVTEITDPKIGIIRYSNGWLTREP